jgi:hypothetical protein
MWFIVVYVLLHPALLGFRIVFMVCFQRMRLDQEALRLNLWKTMNQRSLPFIICTLVLCSCLPFRFILIWGTEISHRKQFLLIRETVSLVHYCAKAKLLSASLMYLETCVVCSLILRSVSVLHNTLATKQTRLHRCGFLRMWYACFSHIVIVKTAALVLGSLSVL